MSAGEMKQQEYGGGANIEEATYINTMTQAQDTNAVEDHEAQLYQPLEDNSHLYFDPTQQV